MAAIRNFTITLNNPFTHKWEEMCDWLEENCSYVVMGCEMGDNGTFHWQGYAELLNKKRLSTLLNLKLGWHVEARRGTQKQAADYCKKEGNWVEHGNLRVQGARKDLDMCRRMALEDGMRGVTSVCNMQGIRVAEKYLTYNEPGRDWKARVVYVTGPSGVGKSRRAREIVDEAGLTDDCFTKNTNTSWWDGYDGHDAVIIDDFRDSWWTLTYTLGLLDRYPFLVEYKGGHRQFLPHLIVLTSIVNPEHLYANTGECRRQLLRRIDEVVDLNVDPEADVPDVPEVGGG